ncbi:MAG: protein tyrosine phosphatase family protein [Pseudomonadota bacterium]
MPVSDAYNFKAVNDQLSTSGLLSPNQLSELSGEGYQAVISLLPSDNEWAVPDEPAIVSAQGLDYGYIPVDFEAPSREDYLAFARAMAANGDKKLLVHCAANYRVSAFYGVYAVKELGWTEPQAREFIADIWNLDEYPVWQEFVTSLLAE